MEFGGAGGTGGGRCGRAPGCDGKGAGRAGGGIEFFDGEAAQLIEQRKGNEGLAFDDGG